MALSQRSVVTRSVWSFNLELEFELIRSAMFYYPIISMDTEFPGIVFPSHPSLRQPQNNYSILKANVDRLHLIQVGLTLSDCHGNLPTFGTANSFIWEFNFCDFNLERDLYAPNSIELLHRQGIDFEKNRKFGIHTLRFAELMRYSGMVCNNRIQWVTFHSAYDFGYLVKALTGQFLPQNMSQFLHLVKVFFGAKVYDVKHLMKFCPQLFGGLERVCQSLNLVRTIGKSHQAGSDSLLILHAFLKIKEMYLEKENDDSMVKYAGVLYGLELEVV